MKNSFWAVGTLFVTSLTGCMQSNPSDVVIDFIDAVENRKYDDARALSSPETDKLINLQESIANFSKDSTPYMSSDIEIIDERIEGDTAYVKFIDPDEEMPSTVKLIKIDGDWLVHITKEDITMKAGFSDEEEEEEGFYEAKDYTDVDVDSSDVMTSDSTTIIE